MRILLLDPGAAGAGNWTIGLLRMPVKMALLQLYSFLRYHQNGGFEPLQDADIQILDLEDSLVQPQNEAAFPDYLSQVEASLKGVDFDWVLISCWSSLKYRLACRVAQICKNLNGQAKVVVGGWHASACPQDFRYPDAPFDHIIIGEGEFALLDLLSGRKNDPIIHGRLVQPHEEVPLLWRDYPQASRVPTLPIFFSRGCPFTCNYCMEPYTKGRSWRALPVPRALERVSKMLAETRAPYLDVHDPLFGAQKSWRRAFFDGLKALDFNRFMWTESRADIFAEADLAQFAQFAFQMDFGVESASPEMLSIIEKTGNPQRFLRKTAQTLLWGSTHNLTSQVYLITHHPGERLRHVQETLAFFEGVVAKMPSTSLISISAQPYRFYPGTAVGRNPQSFFERFGTVIDNPAWWKADGDMRALSHATHDTQVGEAERQAINETWAQGLERLNRQLLNKRSDRAAQIIAKRSAAFLDLALYQQGLGR